MRPCVSGVRRGWSCRGILAAVLVVLLDAGGRSAAAAEEPSGDVVEFTRVRVPQGRLQDVPIGSERHVPVSAAEFDRALARLGSGLRADRPRNLPEAARYELRPDAAGGLVGRVTIEVRDAGPGRFLELGAVRSAGGSVRTARGAGAAVVFGMSGGGTGLATPEPGTYSCDIAFPVSLPDDTRLRLPLVGADDDDRPREPAPAVATPRGGGRLPAARAAHRSGNAEGVVADRRRSRTGRRHRDR